MCQTRRGRVQNEAMVWGIVCLDMTAYDYEDKKEQGKQEENESVGDMLKVRCL